MTHTPYVDFEQGEYKGHHIKRLGCMKCNDTIGSKNPVTNEFYFWDHKRDVKVALSNMSYAHIPVCAPCVTKIVDSDFALFENSVKHGWLLEETWLSKRFPSHHPREHVINAGRASKDVKILGRALK